ncbi:hypothetical protein IEO21_05870 [Rhodonia placenta]|uniref:Uncharacterized protein n=1 Tax=Rhodonia placenta TaxID=104341 RepID=A0A8H7P138_9APHY|nr:hypothetical protein IEO21_05870 [Postia placenta]
MEKDWSAAHADLADLESQVNIESLFPDTDPYGLRSRSPGGPVKHQHQHQHAAHSPSGIAKKTENWLRGPPWSWSRSAILGFYSPPFVWRTRLLNAIAAQQSNFGVRPMDTYLAPESAPEWPPSVPPNSEPDDAGDASDLDLDLDAASPAPELKIEEAPQDVAACGRHTPGPHGADRRRRSATTAGRRPPVGGPRARPLGAKSRTKKRTPKEQEFSCVYCGAKFSYLESVLPHVVTYCKGREGEAHGCPLCQKQGALKWVWTHCRDVHGIGPRQTARLMENAHLLYSLLSSGSFRGHGTATTHIHTTSHAMDTPADWESLLYDSAPTFPPQDPNNSSFGYARPTGPPPPPVLREPNGDRRNDTTTSVERRAGVNQHRGADDGRRWELTEHHARALDAIAERLWREYGGRLEMTFRYARAVDAIVAQLGRYGLEREGPYGRAAVSRLLRDYKKRVQTMDRNTVGANTILRHLRRNNSSRLEMTIPDEGEMNFIIRRLLRSRGTTSRGGIKPNTQAVADRVACLVSAITKQQRQFHPYANQPAGEPQQPQQRLVTIPHWCMFCGQGFPLDHIRWAHIIYECAGRRQQELGCLLCSFSYKAHDVYLTHFIEVHGHHTSEFAMFLHDLEYSVTINNQ